MLRGVLQAWQCLSVHAKFSAIGQTASPGEEQEAQLSLTNRAIMVCKVVEVWQDFLSEYVDKKFTRTYATDG